MVTIVHALLALAVALVLSVAEAAVELEITPDPAALGASVDLSFRVTGEIDQDPDFTALDAALEIIGRNRQSQMSWINGKTERSTTWILHALPRQAGTVEIPAIAFGQQRSTPRQLEVSRTPPAAGTDATGDGDVMLKVEAEPLHPYVQQQVIYTLRLLHRVELSSPRFSQLTTNADAIIKPLGSGRQYTQEVNGRTYQAYEQKYVICPQISGAVRIAPLTLTTDVATGQRSFFDPFGQSFSTRQVRSQAVDIEVKPIPAAFPAGASWLPAKRLRLHEEWDPDVATTDAGTPLTRTLFLWVDGLVSGHLPALKLTTPDGVKLYPDQAQNSEQDTATGFTAVLQQKFAVVAGQAGSVTFAALEVPWWNTETDQLEFARLSARALTVTGGAAVAASAAPAPAAIDRAPTALASDGVAGAAAPASPPAVTTQATERWPTIAALLAGGWALTGLWWWRSQRTAAPAARRTSAANPAVVPRAARAHRDLKGACAADDARSAQQALLLWAQTLPDAIAGTRSLRALARHCGGDLAQELNALERHLYGGASSAWQGQPLWQAFQRQQPVAAGTASAPPVLPEMCKLGAK